MNYHSSILAYANVNFISQADKAELSNRLQYKLLSNSTFMKSPKPKNLLCLKWNTNFFNRCEQLPQFWRNLSPSNLPIFKMEAAIFPEPATNIHLQDYNLNFHCHENLKTHHTTFLCVQIEILLSSMVLSLAL
jgi:hypothetical protein